MALPPGHATLCASCTMFVVLAHRVRGAYFCSKCKHIASLEARIIDLERQLAITGSLNTPDKGDKTSKSEPAGAGLREDHRGQEGEWGGREGQDTNTNTDGRRRGRGKSVRDLSPDFTHPNKYARLQKVDDSGQGLDRPEQETSPSCQESDCDGMETGEGGTLSRTVMVVGDSILRRVDKAVCRKDPMHRTVCCLPGARVRHIADRVDRLLGGAGQDPAVMVHIGTNDKISGRWSVLKSDFKRLGDKLKARTSKVVFSEILPVPRATQERQGELRELNKWLRSWCKKEGFGFLENWADFSVGYQLYSRDGLHLNGAGAALLGERMARRLEEVLN